MELVYQLLIAYVIILILKTCSRPRENFKSCSLASVDDPGIIMGTDSIKPAGILLPKQKDIATAYSVSNVVTQSPTAYTDEPVSQSMASTPAPLAYDGPTTDFEEIPDVSQVLGEDIVLPSRDLEFQKRRVFNKELEGLDCSRVRAEPCNKWSSTVRMHCGTTCDSTPTPVPSVL